MSVLLGEKNGNARLTGGTVVMIRVQYSSGVAQHRLATAYGVSVSTINAILHGRTWGHVGGPILGETWSDAVRERVSSASRGEKNYKAKLTEERVRFLREWHAAGWSIADLARAVGVTRHVAGFATRGKTWSHVKKEQQQHANNDPD